MTGDEQAKQDAAFNRAADLNVTQIMERIGSLEIAVNSMQNNVMVSVVKFLEDQQDQAAYEAEHSARLERLENEAVRAHYARREESSRAWTVGIIGLIIIAISVLLFFIAKQVGG